MPEHVHMTATHAAYSLRYGEAKEKAGRYQRWLFDLLDALRRIPRPLRFLLGIDLDRIAGQIDALDGVLLDVWAVVHNDIHLAGDCEGHDRQRRLREALSDLTAGYVR